MDIKQFVEKYLGKFKPAGKELKVEECPFCKRKKWKFYINSESGMFCCKSGSCDEHGSLLKLQHKFGIKVKFKQSMNNNSTENTIVELTDTEKAEFKEMNAEQYEWWSKRGISRDTLIYMKIQQRRGAIVLPYLQENEIKMIKYRDMVEGKGKKVWQQKGGTPVLWGVDKLDLEKPVILTEGEPDMLSWIEAGYKNVVSVPFGTSNTEWIENNMKYIEKMKEIYISMDNDEAGRKAEKNIMARLGDIINFKKINLGTYSDVNKALVSEGKEKLSYFYDNVQEFKIDGYYYGCDIDAEVELPEYTSLLDCIDVETGGFLFGEVVVWSAYTGCGKTTLLSQMALTDIANGYSVCYYSGEDSKESLTTKMALQLYGEEATRKVYYAATKREEVVLKKEYADKLKKDLGKKLVMLEDEVILNNEELKAKILKALRYDNCRVFILDNLMQIDILKKEQENKNELQKKFVRDLVRFARAYNIQLHLVAHNKKPDTSQSSGKTYDVSGASEIVNLAHKVIGLDKLSDKRKEELADKGIYADGVFNVLKKRSRFGKGGFALLKINRDYQTFYDADLDKPQRVQINKNTFGFEGVEVSDELPELFR